MQYPMRCGIETYITIEYLIAVELLDADEEDRVAARRARIHFHRGHGALQKEKEKRLSFKKKKGK